MGLRDEAWVQLVLGGVDPKDAEAVAAATTSPGPVLTEEKDIVAVYRQAAKYVWMHCVVKEVKEYILTNKKKNKKIYKTAIFFNPPFIPPPTTTNKQTLFHLFFFPLTRDC